MSEESFTVFIKENGTWVLSFTAILSGCIGATLVSFLKSRCTVIRCGCVSCERQVIDLNSDNATLEIANV